MALSSGQRLGCYEILASLGAGGMGEVYRARDTNLNRDVAIKILPEAFAQDADRLARFQREAQVLAALNHPNIAAIHGMEGNSLVMEFVPGDDLKGPLPLDRALPLARQLAEALEYAHANGIVHRDLKPANIKVTPQGQIKVLDFGLAKAFEGPAAAPVSANSPTLSLAATRAGVILGTAAYMSPEQARGSEVDKRADIWSFGVVLYEMLSGQSLYSGPTTSDILAAVLLIAPDWNRLPADTPPLIRRLLRRCLQREIRARLRDMGDARLEIEEAIAAAPEEVASPTAPPLPARRSLLPWLAAAALTLVLSALATYTWRVTRPVEHSLMRLSVEVGNDAALARIRNNGMIAISPDGTRLAMIFRGADGKARLGTRLLNQSQITPLSGTEDAASPFFSPDSQWIAFYSSDNKLKKISVDGGAAATICDVPQLRGASWGDDGNIVLSLGVNASLSKVSSDGGTPVPLTKLKEGERTHRWPHVLPGSHTVLFTAHSSTAGTGYDDASIEVFSLKTGERKTLRRGGFSPRYLPSNIQAGALCRDCGHLVYLHQSTLFAAPFDAKSLSITGPPVPILEDASSNTVAGGDFDFSQTGTFVYVAGRAGNSAWPVVWLDSSGKQQELQPPGRYVIPRLSPDGKRLALTIASGSGEDIWVKDLQRNTPSRLSFLGGSNRHAVWTPDGQHILFSSTDASKAGLYWIRSDGSGEAQRLTDGKSVDLPSSISPDGRRLSFSRLTPNGTFDIYTAAMEGDPAHPQLGKPELFLGTPFNEVFPVFSPDGRWIAYGSDESGTMEIHVRPFPGPGGHWQISTGSGRFPKWSRDGKDLLFESPDSTIMAASYTLKSGAFMPGVPRVWSPVRLLIFNIPNFDVAPDGKRIVAFVPPGEADGQKPLSHITFLLNFFDELKRKTKN